MAPSSARTTHAKAAAPPPVMPPTDERFVMCLVADLLNKNEGTISRRKLIGGPPQVHSAI
jgi:hypothetical protein